MFVRFFNPLQLPLLLTQLVFLTYVWGVLPISPCFPSLFSHSPIMSSCAALRRLTLRSSPRSQPSSRFVVAPSCARLPVHRVATAIPQTVSAPVCRSQTSRFSTMSPRQSTAPVVPGGKEYDPEIKDLADYIHKYNVDSDLAVRTKSSPNPLPLLPDRN